MVGEYWARQQYFPIAVVLVVESDVAVESDDGGLGSLSWSVFVVPTLVPAVPSQPPAVTLRHRAR